MLSTFPSFLSSAPETIPCCQNAQTVVPGRVPSFAFPSKFEEFESPVAFVSEIGMLMNY